MNINKDYWKLKKNCTIVVNFIKMLISSTLLEMSIKDNKIFAIMLN